VSGTAEPGWHLTLRIDDGLKSSSWVVGCSSFVAAVDRTSMLRRIAIVVVLAVVAALSL
jgi:hypothetical protein